MKKASAVLTVMTLTAVCCGSAVAEDRLFAPFLSVGQEYTDNVFDTKDNRRTDYITRLRPGFSSKYEAARWKWDAAYNLDYRYYARDSKTNDLSHDAGLKGTITLMENFFFLDLADTYRRVSLNVFKDETVTSPFANQTEQNIATINPWLLWRPGQKTTLKTGYRYTDTRYWDSIGIDKQAHSAYGDAAYELTEKLSLLANYTFTHQESADRRRYDKHDTSGGFRYAYAEKSSLYANAGYTWQFYPDRSASRYLFWNAGLTHDFTWFVATLEARRQNTEDPLSTSTRETTYQAKLERAFERGSISINGGYTEYDVTDTITTTGGNDRHKVFAGINGRYEIMDGLSATAGIGGEHYTYSQPAATDYPYRLTASAGLAWQLLKDLTLSLSYTRVSNQYHLDNTSGGWSTNRAMLDLKMVF